MNGIRPWIVSGLFALAALAAPGAGSAQAQFAIGGGGWSGPGARWNSWGVSVGAGSGAGMWNMPIAGPVMGGPGWIEPVPLARSAVFPPFGPPRPRPMVVPAPVVVRQAPVVFPPPPVFVRPAPVMVRPAPVVVRPVAPVRYYGRYGW